MGKKAKAKKVAERNPYDNPKVREALAHFIEEGRKQLTETEKMTLDNVDTLVSALLKAIYEPGCEIRLTYRTTAMALCAWEWTLDAARKIAQKHGVPNLVDKEKCSAFDVEFTNGSGIMFWTEEDVTANG
jgi:hypothetical protein